MDNMCMKKNLRLLSLILLVAIALSTLVACDDPNPAPQPTPGGNNTTFVDYTDALKLDMNSTTAKKEVTVRYYIDGDTTHFFPKGSTAVSEVLKARYLGVDTPESTGAIEKWGKAASHFTEQKLSTATSILIESDDANWNEDGNGRNLLWVWYQPAADADYRLLNLELVQEGLGHATGGETEGRYGKQLWDAYMQAEAHKKYVHSKDTDPDYPDGVAIPVTIKELRLNIDKYLNQNVMVEGISNFNADQTSYLEEFDAETDMYYAIQVYYGYQSNRTGLFTQGNRVRVVGTVQDFHGTYQITNLTYEPLRNNPANIKVISTGNSADFRETTAERWCGTETLEIEGKNKSFTFGELAVSSSISMTGLTIKKVYTTTNPDASDIGALTITCEQNGYEVQIRTEVLKDADGNLITASDFPLEDTLSVKGIIDYYDHNSDDDKPGVYQIRVYNYTDLVVS